MVEHVLQPSVRGRRGQSSMKRTERAPLPSGRRGTTTARSARTGGLGAVTAVAAALLGGEAAAQAPAGQAPPPAQQAAADGAAPTAAELRERGARAAAAQQYEACVKEYSKALAMERDAATAGELGLCEEALGQNVAAYEHGMEALAREVPASPPAVRAQWERFRSSARRLDRKVARVLLSVSPSEAVVFLDGVSLGPYGSGRIFAVLPGKHTWLARAPGHEDAVVEHMVAGGDAPDIMLQPRAQRRSPPATAAAPAPAPVCPACQPPRPAPCDAADDLPMSVDLCNALRIRWRRMDPTLGLVAGGLLSLGFTPDVGPGFFLGGEAHWRRQGEVQDWGFQVGAEARFVMPTYAGSTLDKKEHITITLMELAVAPCVRYKWALGCAVVSPGMALGGGSLFEVPENQGLGPQVLFVMGVGPRLGVDIPVAERFGIRVFGELRFGPLPPTGFAVNGIRVIWDEPKVSGFLGIAAAYR